MSHWIDEDQSEGGLELIEYCGRYVSVAEALWRVWILEISISNSMSNNIRPSLDWWMDFAFGYKYKLQRGRFSYSRGDDLRNAFFSTGYCMFTRNGCREASGISPWYKGRGDALAARGAGLHMWQGRRWRFPKATEFRRYVPLLVEPRCGYTYNDNVWVVFDVSMRFRLVNRLSFSACPILILGWSYRVKSITWWSLLGSGY